MSLKNKGGYEIKSFSIFFFGLLFLLSTTALLTADSVCNDFLSLDRWYEETAKEIRTGKPLVITQYVALCDNKYQGIVPVPAHLGDGDDPEKNLYWGAAYGYRTFFKGKTSWTYVDSFDDPGQGIIETHLFKRTVRPTGAWKQDRVTKPFTAYLVLRGYRGKYIEETNNEFLKDLFGEEELSFEAASGEIIHAGGKSHIVSYAGHNYLMDLSDRGKSLLARSKKKQTRPKAVMILACASKPYFLRGLRTPRIHPLLLTNNLMAPEAYTAAAVYDTVLAGQNAGAMLQNAAGAYATYQRIAPKAAKGLFFTGN